MPRERRDAPQAPSIDREAGSSDWRGVFRDLAGNEFLQIRGRAALGRDADGAHLLEPLLHRGRLHRLDRGVMELLNDRLGGTPGQKEAEPCRGLEVEALLLRAGELR